MLWSYHVTLLSLLTCDTCTTYFACPFIRTSVWKWLLHITQLYLVHSPHLSGPFVYSLYLHVIHLPHILCVIHHYMIPWRHLSLWWSSHLWVLFLVTCGTFTTFVVCTVNNKYVCFDFITIYAHSVVHSQRLTVAYNCVILMLIQIEQHLRDVVVQFFLPFL